MDFHEYKTYQYVQLLISIRLRQLHQEGMTVYSLMIWSEFSLNIFLSGKPSFLNELTNRILNISTDDIIRYLSLDAATTTDKNALNEVILGVSMKAKDVGVFGVLITILVSLLSFLLLNLNILDMGAGFGRHAFLVTTTVEDNKNFQTF